MSEELCDGVRMLIERMQTNPDDFAYGSRLYEFSNMASELMDENAHHRLWFLSGVEKQELITAYKNMHKHNFTANVVQSIFAPEPEWNINTDRPYKSPSKIIAPHSLISQAEKILEQEFDKEFEKQYAKISNP